LSDTKAKEVTQAVEAVAKEKSDSAFETYKSSVREDFLRLELKLEQKITENKAELMIEIANSKAETIKWFVGIGLTTFLALAAMIIGLYFKK
jgi:hypothetical protein